RSRFDGGAGALLQGFKFVDVLLHGVIAGHALEFLPGVVLGPANKIHHARALAADIPFGGLLVKGIEFQFHFVGRFEIAFRSLDRKSTRLNSSHVKISYAVFCLKKKKKKTTEAKKNRT